MKAVILSRVSTKEQEDGHSLDAQTIFLKEYCKRKNLEVLKEFRIIESSTRGERKEFKEMLNFIEKQKIQIALVCHKVDRLQRSFKEYNRLNDLMYNNQLEIHFSSEGSILSKDSNSSQKMMWNMQITGSQFYTDSISDNVKRSVDKKIIDGTILYSAPLGYINLKDGKGGVEVDREKAIIIKKIFQEHSTGLYSLKYLKELAYKLGLRTKQDNPASISTIERILKNPFYYGYMRIHGKTVKHIYESIITKRLFEMCQNVINNRGYKKDYSKETKEPFIFSKLIRCKNCGCLISCEKKKGKYVYLRPNSKKDCNCKQISEKQALDLVNGVLDRFYIKESKLKILKNVMSEVFELKNKESNELLTSNRRQFDVLERKKNKLLNLYLNESITQNEYDKKKLGLQEMQHNINKQIQNLTESDESLIISIEYMLDVVSKSKYIFKSSGNRKKRRLLAIVFSNFILTDVSLCFALKKPFDAMVKLVKSSKWRPQRDSNPCCRLERPVS